MSANSTFAKLSAAVITAALAFDASSATAFMLNSSSGSWSNPVGGAGIVYQTVGGEKQIRWGDPASYPYGTSEKSGLGFTGVGGTTFTSGQTILLGRLQHFNNPIWGGTAALAVNLTILLDLAEFGLKTFDFTLSIDETLNQMGTCKYHSTADCADNIFWDRAIASNSFNVGNKHYTLQLLGFSDTSGGSLVKDFISQEGQNSQAYLSGKITAVSDEEPASVPEPTTSAAGILLGLYFATRRRHKKAKV